MAQLDRFDVAEYEGQFMVVIESSLLPPDPAVVVIPLIEDYPAVPFLNAKIPFDGYEFVLATRLITSVRRASLQKAGNVEDRSDDITRAVDVLMGGF